jgi:hypothetical protein
MSRISDYPAMTAPAVSDVVVGVDTSDTTQAASGTTKKLTLDDLATFIQGFTGLQAMKVTSAPTTPVAITATTISNAVLAGAVGLYLDPRQVWDMTGLVIAPGSFGSLPAGISNFRISMGAIGSIGWTGNLSHGPGYIKTDSSTSADGIQIYSDGTFETQGIVFENCVFAGSNSSAVVHLGGRQRDCLFDRCFIYNTNAVRTTVASGSNAVDVTTFTGSSTLNVASAASFASAGNVVVATSTVMATVKYTGKTGTTLTGCKTLGGIGTLSTGGTVGQAAFGLVTDTALSDNNSENSDFSLLRVAGGNCAVGIGINDQTQKSNDCLWTGLKTAAGLVSLVAVEGANHQFKNAYDRSSPAFCVVANHGAALIFDGGEAYNPTGGPHELLNTSSAATSYVNRLLTAGTSTNQIVNAGGRFRLTGRGVLNGTCAMSASASLGIADPVSTVNGLTVTGSSGSVYQSAFYVAANAQANLGGFSGTPVKTSSWT